MDLGEKIFNGKRERKIAFMHLSVMNFSSYACFRGGKRVVNLDRYHALLYIFPLTCCKRKKKKNGKFSQKIFTKCVCMYYLKTPF